MMQEMQHHSQKLPAEEPGVHRWAPGQQTPATCPHHPWGPLVLQMCRLSQPSLQAKGLPASPYQGLPGSETKWPHGWQSLLPAETNHGCCMNLFAQH